MSEEQPPPPSQLVVLSSTGNTASEALANIGETIDYYVESGASIDNIAINVNGEEINIYTTIIR